MKNSFYSVLAGIMLVMPVYAQEPIRSVADAMHRLPEMPTVEQLTNSQAKDQYAVKLTTFNLALEQTTFVEQEFANLNMQMEKVRQKQAKRGQAAMKQYNKNVEAGLMPSQQEMMQILMSSGINLEKASDQQIMDIVADNISKKWGISKDEYLKIINMAQRNPKQTEVYLKANHPDLYQRLYDANADSEIKEESNDPRDERFAQIGEELQGLQEQLMRAESRYMSSRDQMLETISESWENSEEAKQVDKIEHDLWQRIDQWISKLNYSAQDGNGVAYPGWWTDGRKKENALIDTWNSREAQSLLEKTNAYQQELKDIFNKIADLETENEQLSKNGGTDNMIYLMNKQSTLNLRNQLIQLLVPYRDALSFPAIDHQEENGSAHLGKG